MTLLHKKLRSKIKVPTIYGASDQKVTRFFIFNRAWIANERILLLTTLLVLGMGLISYATFALPAGCGLPQHPDGALVEQAGNPTVWLMQNGQRRGMTSEQALASYGFTYAMVKTANCSDLVAPIGPNIGMRVGTIVKGSGVSIYMVTCGEYYCNPNTTTMSGFPSWEVYSSLGYDATSWTLLPDSMLNAIPINSYVMDGNLHGAGNLVTIGGTVYMPYNSALLGIPNWQVAGSWHFNTALAKPATAYEQTWPRAILGMNEGALMMGSGPTVWVADETGGNITAGNWLQKRGFTSPQVMTDLGYTYNDVYNVADSSLPLLSGEVITETAVPPPTGGGGSGGGSGGTTTTSARVTSDRNPANVKEFHILYVVPSNGVDEHLDTGSTRGSITNTMNAVQTWIRTQPYGRAFRIDSYAGKPDITYVKTGNSLAYYKSIPSTSGAGVPLISAVRSDIIKAKPGLLLSNKKYVIFFEGGSDACGVTSKGLYSGGDTTLIEIKAVQGSASCNSLTDFTTRTSGTPTLVAHEMMHALGAVSKKATGPNTCVNRTLVGDHVGDLTDLMTNGPILYNARLDINNDSYWGPHVNTAGCVRVDTDPSSAPYLM